MLYEQVGAALLQAQISLAGSVVSIPGVNNGVFVPIRVTRNPGGTSEPTKKSILGAKAALEALGFLPEFLFVDDGSTEAEYSLRSSLLVSFPDLVRNAFLSIEAAHSNVWIETKRSLSAEDRARVDAHIHQFAELFKLPPPSLLTLADFALPTRFETLALIRTLAPIDCVRLRDALEQRGYVVPSLDWVNRQFDLLRKAGLVARKGDRHYTLTLDALRRLGTTKTQQSPDVQRVLALARGRV